MRAAKDRRIHRNVEANLTPGQAAKGRCQTLMLLSIERARDSHDRDNALALTCSRFGEVR